jgi:hypothetical protein
MATKESLIGELQFLSDKLSERSRVIAAGVLAIWWASLVGDKSPPHLTAIVLLGPAICAAISILLDLLQYLVAYEASVFALRRLERENATEFKFNPRNFLYRIRGFLFTAKQVATIAAICWLIILIAKQISQ